VRRRRCRFSGARDSRLARVVSTDLTFEVAKPDGLDIERATADWARPETQALPGQDVEELTALRLTSTPSFRVKGPRRPSIGPARTSLRSL